MEKELSRALNNLKEKTGIAVQAVSENGEFFASTISEYQPLPKDLNLTTMPIVQRDGKTYFKFNFGGNLFYAVIFGESQLEKSYVGFISACIEFAENKPKQLSYDEQLALIITGSSTKSRTLQFMSEYSISKHPIFVMMVKIAENNVSDVTEFISDYYGSSGIAVTLSQDVCVCIKYVEPTDEYDLLTPVKQAEALSRSIFEELGTLVRVYLGSTVKSFSDVSLSYSQAVAVEGFVKNPKEAGVFAYKDYVLSKMVEELPQDKISEYLTSLSFGGGEIFKDKELLETGECFLKNNLNVSETARDMYLHRNTLIYRLEKIEKLTGLDIRKFDDALNFKLLYIIYKAQSQYIYEQE